MKETKETQEGQIIETLPDTTFRVRLKQGTEILAHLSGKMRLHYIRVMLGDRVLLEIEPDGSRGRIIRRL